MVRVNADPEAGLNIISHHSLTNFYSSDKAVYTKPGTLIVEKGSAITVSRAALVISKAIDPVLAVLILEYETHKNLSNMRKVNNYNDLLLNEQTSWKILSSIISVEFMYNKPKNTDYRLTTNKKTGISHVFDDTNEMVDSLLDEHYELCYQKQQEDKMNKPYIYIYIEYRPCCQ